MKEESDSTNPLRQILSGLIGVVIVSAAAGLGYAMVKSGGILGAMGVSVLPLVVGWLVGLAMRYSCAEGSFGLASLGCALILLLGLACSAIRHKVMFDAHLTQDAVTAFEETLAYAKNVVPAEADDEALRRFMKTEGVSAIGRLTPVGNGPNDNDYWETRNFIHLHWVATRQIVLYGQGGVDKTIAKASSVLGDEIFLDHVVTAVSKTKPVTDEVLKQFRQYELPFLKQVLSGKITAKDFEQPLIDKARSRVDWLTFATNGFEPFLGMALLGGAIIAYKLVREPSETEMI
jgi:hypothetical protein